MTNLYYLHFRKLIPANSIAHINDDGQVYHINGRAFHKAARSHLVKPYLLEVGAHVKKGFKFKDIKIGVNSQLPRWDIDILANTAFDVTTGMDDLLPTQVMTMAIHNTAPEEQLFDCLVYVRPL